MVNLKPLKIHTILGTSTVWTDELWDEALTYLLERVGTLDALAMAQILYSDRMPNYPHKVDYLRGFRKYPPTVLLETFDYIRAVKAGSELNAS